MSTLVLHGGRVFTADAAGSWASAVAVVDGRIAAVGGDDAVREHLASADQVVDLDGRMLLPGFTDAHVHAVMGGIERNGCDLTGHTTIDDYRRIIAAHAADAGEWILGGGWSMEAFPSGRARREVLDELLGARPVFLPNRDRHSAWVSSEALRRAGVDRTTPDPPGGRIERDDSGEPSGMLHEDAMGLVERIIPARTQDEHDAGLLTAARYLNSLGIIGWQDALLFTDLSIPNAHEAYRRGDAQGWLSAKVSGALWWDRYVPADGIDAEVARLAAIRAHTNADGDKYRVNTVKIAQDGVAETFTASMLEPYLDRDGNPTDDSGLKFLAPDLLAAVVRALHGAGFQIHAHTLGDGAVRDMLDALEAAYGAAGDDDRRHTLCHLQFVDPADVPRLRRLGASANLQALWAAHEPQVDDLTVPFVGQERAARMYPFGEIARTGAMLAMGSDWPVTSPDPLRAIHVAVNRVAPGASPGTRPLGVGQELALTTALRAYTAGSAYVNRRDAESGTLRVGAAADLVVLDRDLFDAPATEIADAQVDHTFLDGHEVYTRRP